eukprot:gene25154-32814_t
MLGLLGLASGLSSLAMAIVGPGWSFPAFCALAAVAGVCVSSWNGVQLSEVARACPPHLVREASAGATLIIFLGMPSPHHITRLFTDFSAEELATATVDALVSKEVLAVVSEQPLSSFSDIGQSRKWD